MIRRNSRIYEAQTSSPSPSFRAREARARMTRNIATARFRLLLPTGFEEPESIAVMAPAHEKKYTLFVRRARGARSLDRKRAESKAGE